MAQLSSVTEMFVVSSKKGLSSNGSETMPPMLLSSERWQTRKH